MAAELIIEGKIYTADKNHRIAEAFAVEEGKIVYVGTREQAEAFADDKTRIQRYERGLIVPGMTEGHAHITSTTELIFGVRLMDAPESVEGYREVLQKYAKEHPDEAVITGGGFENGVFGELGPTAEILDEMEQERPVVLVSSDHHSHWVNSRAMKLMGLNENTPDVDNGVIVRYPGSRRPTGWLKEMAAAMIEKIVPDLTVEQYREAILYYQQIALENGVTNAFEPMFDRKRDYEVRYQAYEELAKEEKLQVTFRVAYTLEPKDDVDQIFARADKIHRKLEGFDKVQMNTIKLFVDGVVEGHTAFLREEYADAPGDCGEPMYSQEDMNYYVQRALRAGYRVHTHAIGDAAIDYTLHAYDWAQKSLGGENYRNAITHLQVVVPEHVEQMKELGVVAVTNPYWHFKNPVYYDNLEIPFLGEERASREYALGSFVRAGIVMSQASDFPVTVPPSTMDCLHIMVNRKRPGAAEMSPLAETEAVSVEDALQVLTMGGAYQNDLEGRKGSLEAGKDADFAVLNQDPLTMEKEELYTTKVTETYVGGSCVWKLETQG